MKINYRYIVTLTEDFLKVHTEYIKSGEMKHESYYFINDEANKISNLKNRAYYNNIKMEFVGMYSALDISRDGLYDMARTIRKYNKNHKGRDLFDRTENVKKYFEYLATKDTSGNVWAIEDDYFMTERTKDLLKGKCD